MSKRRPPKRKPKKKTLVELVEATSKLKAKRDLSKRRMDKARVERLAPSPPRAAIERFAQSMRVYAKTVAQRVQRRVVNALPILGSGDPLDLAALYRGLELLRADLYVLAERLSGPATTAGSRVVEHGRKEASRMLNTTLPEDPATRAMVRSFAEATVARMRAAADAQVEQIRKAIDEYEEGTSMREAIERATWVSRNRSSFVARDTSYMFHRTTVAYWCRRGGSEWGIYVTARDERVRPTHRAHDGKKFRWDAPPSTLSEPNCRCRMVPVEADLV